MYRVAAGDRQDERGLAVDVLDASSSPSIDERGISFDLDLAARGSWAATIRYGILDNGTWHERPMGRDPDGRARQRATWRRGRPSIRGPDPLRRAFERAADDLFDLRNWEL